MAYDFVSSDFIHWGDALDDHNVDWTLSLWVCPDGASNTGYAFSHWVSNAGFFFRRKATDASEWQFGINAAGGSVETLSCGAGTVTQDAYQHILITFDDSGADGSCVATVYKNNSQIGINSTLNRVVANAAECGVGNRTDLARSFDGAICEVAWWRGTLLGASERAALAKGYSPILLPVRPTLYAPLIRNIDAQIGGQAGTNVGSVATRQHAPIIYAGNPWLVVPAAGGSSTNLTVQDASHAHAADGPTLTTDSTLAVQDAAHAHAADNLTLTTEWLLTVADASHAHAAEQPTLTLGTNLAVADASHAHAADNAALTTDSTLVVDDGLHAHAADNIVLTGDVDAPVVTPTVRRVGGGGYLVELDGKRKQPSPSISDDEEIMEILAAIMPAIEAQRFAMGRVQ